MDLGGVAFLTGLVGLLGAGGWLLAHFGRRRREALVEAAGRLGLEATGPDLYAGSVQGVSVQLGIGVKVVEGAPLSHVTVLASFPASPGFSFQIAQAGAWPLRDAKVEGDEAFNRACELRSPEPERLLTLLSDPACRDTVREFIRVAEGCSQVDQDGAMVKVVSAHLRGSQVILDAVHRSVQVVLALSAAAP